MRSPASLAPSAYPKVAFRASAAVPVLRCHGARAQSAVPRRAAPPDLIRSGRMRCDSCGDWPERAAADWLLFCRFSLLCLTAAVPVHLHVQLGPRARRADQDVAANQGGGARGRSAGPVPFAQPSTSAAQRDGQASPSQCGRAPARPTVHQVATVHGVATAARAAAGLPMGCATGRAGRDVRKPGKAQPAAGGCDFARQRMHCLPACSAQPGLCMPHGPAHGYSPAAALARMPVGRSAMQRSAQSGLPACPPCAQ